jgi:hypothetical protein
MTVRNWQDRFLSQEERAQDIDGETLMDSGAVQTSLPVEIVEALKLNRWGGCMPALLTAHPATTA